jgi:riboflavin synthase
MFTGLVEETGETLDLSLRPGAARLVVRAPIVSADAKLGDSIAVNGCCLSVVQREADQLTFDLLDETLNRTNLRNLVPGSAVNLERALAANGRLGGHFVQGHIDCTADVLNFVPVRADHHLEIAVPQEFAHYVAFKGSIAVDGISLTVAEVSENSIGIWIIPHTLATTNLRGRATGQRVNLEFDLLAKYVARILHRPF